MASIVGDPTEVPSDRSLNRRSTGRSHEWWASYGEYREVPLRYLGGQFPRCDLRLVDRGDD